MRAGQPIELGFEEGSITHRRDPADTPCGCFAADNSEVGYQLPSQTCGAAPNTGAIADVELELGGSEERFFILLNDCRCHSQFGAALPKALRRACALGVERF